MTKNATVFVNGKSLANHKGWNSLFNVLIERADTLQKPIILSVFIENYSNEGGIDRPVRVNFLRPDSRVLTNWWMKGGVGDVGQNNDWAAVKDTAGQKGPCFYPVNFFVFNK